MLLMFIRQSNKDTLNFAEYYIKKQSFFIITGFAS
jgi:hypothetical protein